MRDIWGGGVGGGSNSVLRRMERNIFGRWKGISGGG